MADNVRSRIDQAAAAGTSFNALEGENNQDPFRPGPTYGEFKYIDNEGKPVTIKVQRSILSSKPTVMKKVGGDWVEISNKEFEQYQMNTQQLAEAAGISRSQMPTFVTQNADKVEDFFKNKNMQAFNEPESRQMEKTDGPSPMERGRREAANAEEMPQWQPEGQREENEATRRLQGHLKAAGFDPGEIDGYFGDNTLAAVNKFKEAQGLNPDGVVDDTLYTRLMSAKRSNRSFATQ